MVSDLNEYRRRVVDSHQLPDKVPPQAVEVEEVILGGILLDPYAIERVVDVLTPEAFYLSAHQEIYKSGLMLHALKQPTDLTTIASCLESRGLLEKVGGKSKLVDLIGKTVSAVNIDQYAEIVIEKYQRRKLIKACLESAEQAYDGRNDWAKLQSDAEQKIFNLSPVSGMAGLRPIGDIMVEEYARVEDLAQGKSIPGIPSGFYDLDAMTNGFKPGQLIIVAGRPAMGKSSCAAAIMRHVAGQGFPTVLFSLEMSGGEVASRLWAAESGVSSSALNSGAINNSDWAQLMSASATLSNLPVWIDESQSITTSTILTQCRKLKAMQSGLGLVVIDYLHLLLGGEDEDVRELSRITRESKRMARELGCPVMLLSQLNRNVESQSDKRPSMAHLRGSGAIEQDSDLVILLYRDEYYNPNTHDKGIAELIVAKHRNGPTGTVKLLFDGHYTRFRNLKSRNHP